MYINITKKHILIFSLIIGALITYILSGDSSNDADIQKDIAKKVIRFHVLANSDSDADQALKLKVKDAVVNYLNEYMSESESLEESKEILKKHTDNIIAVANKTIEAEGYCYTVDAYFCEDFFPTKSYGDVTLPAGDYTAYRIEIGEHEGKNWWCILYPPLCFVDATYGLLPDESRDLLKNVLDEDEFNAVTGNISSDNTKFRFKYLTFLNPIFD